MTELDKLIAHTQRNVTYAYWVLFAVVIGTLIFLPRPLDESIKTLLITLAGILGTLVTFQNQFWFARSRTAGVPDPTTTTTTTEVKTPSTTPGVTEPTTTTTKVESVTTPSTPVKQEDTP